MIAKIEDVKHGNVLWYVTVYTVRGVKKAFVERMEIVGEIYKNNADQIFCKCKKEGTSYEYDFSLCDTNIIPNSYNEHMTFATEAEAYAYIGKLLERAADMVEVTKLKKENASLRRVLGTILDATSPMVKINAISEARGLLAK